MKSFSKLIKGIKQEEQILVIVLVIYALLDSYIKTGEIHALTIKATTPSEPEK